MPETVFQPSPASPSPSGERLLSLIADQCGEYIAAFDGGFRLTSFNRAYHDEVLRLYGWDVTPGTPMAEVLAQYPDDLAHARTLWERAMRGEEFTVVVPFGGTWQRACHYEINFRTLWGGDGTPIGVFQVGRDVTLRERARADFYQLQDDLERRVQERAAELRESEERFRAIFEKAPLGMAQVALDGTFLRVNEAFCRTTGYSRIELMGMTFRGITHPDDLAADLAQRERLIAGEIPSYAQEKRYLRRDGSTVWVNLTGSVVRASDGRPRYFVAVVQDISARRRAEEELNRLYAEVREANQAKTDFLATMSHELRTPLNAIVGYAELLELGIPEELGPRSLERVGRIRRSSAHLQQMIEEILAYSRTEAGRETAEVERVPVVELLRDVAASIEPLAGRKGLAFRLSIAGAPATLQTDPLKLRQILLNLLGNAVKFTGEGEVELTVEQRGHHASFRVRDTGPGIHEEHLERLFDPFWQVDRSLTRKAEGSGLGLAIARRYAHLLHGEIVVQSRPGEGSTFSLVLPLL